jgi:hypothetical protein
MQLSLLTSFQLIERDTQLNSYLLLIILLCFAFVGIARVAQPDLITQTFVGFFKMKRIDNSGFEGNKLQPSMTALIILNYLVSLGMGAFLILVKYNSAWLAVNFSFLIILTLTSIQVINFRLASLLSGEKPILDMMSAINKQVWSFGGFLLLVLSLFWVLNQESHIHFERLYVLIVMALMIWRMVKGLRLALQLRYKWYYLILYLCTLEILPLLILFKLAWHNFSPLI